VSPLMIASSFTCAAPSVHICSGLIISSSIHYVWNIVRLYELFLREPRMGICECQRAGRQRRGEKINVCLDMYVSHSWDEWVPSPAP
jgi:hypothetical protein